MQIEIDFSSRIYIPTTFVYLFSFYNDNSYFAFAAEILADPQQYLRREELHDYLSVSGGAVLAVFQLQGTAAP